MKILLTTPNQDLNNSDFLRSGNVIHAPSLYHAPAEHLLDALILHGATALITSRRPKEMLLRRWSEIIKGPKFISYVIGNPSWSTPPDIGELKQADTSLDSIGEALRRCEHWFTLNRLTAESLSLPDEERRGIVLVGAGIVNLITALYLTENGYETTIVDRSPAPGGDDWRRYGCTHSGDDARMFTFTEMDSYNNQNPQKVNPEHFRVPVERKGWLALNRLPTSREEEEWIADFQRIPSWLARAYNDDIFAFNADAYDDWTYLRRRYSILFEDIVLVDDILRVYSDPEHLDAAVARHRSIGAIIRELTSVEIAHEFPALTRPFHEGILSGGFLVPGFTLNVHKFSNKIIDYLKTQGVSFHWDTPVVGVKRDTSGRILGFSCPKPLPNDAHVVASPGIHGSDLLEGSPCKGKIHGVLGGWIRISNDKTSLGNSLKVARKGHVTEDANVTVALDADRQKILIVGSGYGYVGCNPGAVHEQQLAAMKHGILDTIERLFPDRAPLHASSRAAENYDFKFCVRPWTATSLGIYHAEMTDGGGLFIVNGGHNTGGFAQAPAIARAVLASLQGEPNSMHRLYHPERFTAFADGDDIATSIEKQSVTWGS